MVYQIIKVYEDGSECVMAACHDKEMAYDYKLLLNAKRKLLSKGLGTYDGDKFIVAYRMNEVLEDADVAKQLEKDNNIIKSINKKRDNGII